VAHRPPAIDRILIPQPHRSPAASAGTPDGWEVTPRPLNTVTKRALDVSLSLESLCMVSPLLLLIAASIKLEEGGPILFWQ
jgi:lipopolysaccharide/colanic/teichoic acid biosynthesis glycosyltransferase